MNNILKFSILIILILSLDSFLYSNNKNDQNNLIDDIKNESKYTIEELKQQLKKKNNWAYGMGWYKLAYKYKQKSMLLKSRKAIDKAIENNNIKNNQNIFLKLKIEIEFEIGNFTYIINNPIYNNNNELDLNLRLIKSLSHLGLFIYEQDNKQLELFNKNIYNIQNELTNKKIHKNISMFIYNKNNINKIQILSKLIKRFMPSVYSITEAHENIYDEPNRNSSIISKIDNSTILLKIESQKKWLLVTFNNQSNNKTYIGYIKKSKTYERKIANPIELIKLLTTLSESLYSKEEYEKVIDIQSKLIEFENTIWNLYILGKAYFMIDEYKNAIKTFTKIEKIQKNYWASYYYKGLSYYFLHQLSEAKNELEKSIKLQKKNVKAFYFLASINFKLQNYKKALDNLDNLFKLDKSYLSGILLKFDIYEEIEDKKSFEEFFKKVYPSINDDEEIFYTYIEYQIKIKNYNIAINKIKLFIKNNKYHEYAYYLLGRIYTIKKKYNKAYDSFLKSYNKGYKKSNVYIRISTILYNNLNKKNEGISWLKKAINKYSENIDKLYYNELKNNNNYEKEIKSLLSFDLKKKLINPFETQDKTLKNYVRDLTKNAKNDLEKIKLIFLSFKTKTDEYVSDTKVKGLNITYDHQYLYDSNRYEKTALKLFNEALTNKEAKGICSEQSYLFYAMGKIANLDCYFVEEDTGFITNSFLLWRSLKNRNYLKRQI